MAASTRLATLAELKLYLGISESGESDPVNDDLLGQLIDYASERIESHCERAFAEGEITEYHDGSGIHRIVLRRRPVTDLSAVYEDADREFGEATKLLELDLVLYPEKGLVVRVGAVFPEGALNVKVVYTAGYETIPDDVAAACVKLAASWYAHARAGADGVLRETLGDYSALYEHRALPADVEACLAPYRERAVG